MSLALPFTTLTAEALAPYGTLLGGAPGEIATPAPGVTENDGTPGAFAATILARQPVQLAGLEIRSLERHPHSAQTFIPISAGRWLLLVVPALADGTPDSGGARAFLPAPDQAVSIHRNVWHAGLTVFDRPAEFAMFMWKAAAADDSVVHDLATSINPR